MVRESKSDFRNQQKIKDKQINFLLGDLEKNLEDYRQALEIKEKQLTDAKRILISAKQSFDKIKNENRDLKACIENLKQHFQRENQKQQPEVLKQQKAYYIINLLKKIQKKFKKSHLKKKKKVKTNQNLKRKKSLKMSKNLK